MRLLLDECVPRPLKLDLIGHDVRHVVDMGWSSTSRGQQQRARAMVKNLYPNLGTGHVAALGRSNFLTVPGRSFSPYLSPFGILEIRRVSATQIPTRP